MWSDNNRPERVLKTLCLSYRLPLWAPEIVTNSPWSQGWTGGCTEQQLRVSTAGISQWTDRGALAGHGWGTCINGVMSAEVPDRIHSGAALVAPRQRQGFRMCLPESKGFPEDEGSIRAAVTRAAQALAEPLSISHERVRMESQPREARQLLVPLRQGLTMKILNLCLKQPSPTRCLKMESTIRGSGLWKGNSQGTTVPSWATLELRPKGKCASLMYTLLCNFFYC